ncbi:MAG: phage Gp37/Gp68 family protein [Erythrobacter sp.]|nr:phage Gp37/Gp68 family protein [Erythrobacter sp.]
MADGTHIEWTDATWNPITGCSLASPGCTNCYAMHLAGTRLKNEAKRAGLTREVNGNHVWTGEVRFNEAELLAPLRWKRPRMIFVCAHGDLFHESVPSWWLDRIFAVMALCPQHTFQVLTKRADRMRVYLTLGRHIEIQQQTRGLGLHELDRRERMESHVQRGALLPLPNVWLGVSVEDQQRADERIPDLLATPAAVRWISAEPLLGPVDLTNISGAEKSREYGSPVHGWSAIWRNNGIGRACLDWVVVGGESGSKGRPMHPDWARSLRDQCAAAGVPFFFKQWGESCPLRAELIPVDRRNIGWVAKDGRFKFDCSEADHRPMYRDDDRYGAGYWKQTLRVGKKRAGRLLDGVEHNGMPGDV